MTRPTYADPVVIAICTLFVAEGEYSPAIEVTMLDTGVVQPEQEAGRLFVVIQFPDRVRVSEEERLDALVDRAGIRAFWDDGLVDFAVPMFGFDRKPSSDGGGDALVRYDKFDRI